MQRPTDRPWRSSVALLAAMLVACSQDTPDTTAKQVLLAALANKSALDADAVGAALDVIAKSPRADALPLVIELARDRDLGEEVRFAAVHALGRFDGEEARAVLHDLAVTDQSELIRDEAALAATGKKGGP
jgi:HEAT repeat protein